MRFCCTLILTQSLEFKICIFAAGILERTFAFIEKLSTKGREEEIAVEIYREIKTYPLFSTRECEHCYHGLFTNGWETVRVKGSKRGFERF